MGVETYIHAAEGDWPDSEHGHLPEMQNPVARRYCRPEYAKKRAEGDADSSNRAGLDDEEQRPAVKKSPERPQRFAQVDVLAACAGHHGGEFAIAERSDDGQKSG